MFNAFGAAPVMGPWQGGLARPVGPPSRPQFGSGALTLLSQTDASSGSLVSYVGGIFTAQFWTTGHQVPFLVASSTPRTSRRSATSSPSSSRDRARGSTRSRYARSWPVAHRALAGRRSRAPARGRAALADLGAQRGAARLRSRRRSTVVGAPGLGASSRHGARQPPFLVVLRRCQVVLRSSSSSTGARAIEGFCGPPRIDQAQAARVGGRVVLPDCGGRHVRLWERQAAIPGRAAAVQPHASGIF